MDWPCTSAATFDLSKVREVRKKFAPATLSVSPRQESLVCGEIVTARTRRARHIPLEPQVYGSDTRHNRARHSLARVPPNFSRLFVRIEKNGTALLLFESHRLLLPLFMSYGVN